MDQNITTAYSDLPLNELTKRLGTEYYDVIEPLLGNIRARLEEIKDTEDAELASNYTKACSELAGAVDEYIQHYNCQLLPYIQELYEKDTTGHNCANCSGACHIGHSSHLVTITEGHMRILSQLYEVHKASMPFHFDTRYPKIFQSLRNEVLIAGDLLRELFVIEETCLVKGIISSQKKINAHS